MAATGVTRYPSTRPQRSMPPEPGSAPACEGAANPEIWFPERGDHDAEDAAKAICRRCHFRNPCLEFALVTRQPDGIWGAKNPNQRARILRQIHEQILERRARNGGPR